MTYDNGLHSTSDLQNRLLPTDFHITTLNALFNYCDRYVYAPHNPASFLRFQIFDEGPQQFCPCVLLIITLT
jgi:hypothetical protein